MADTTQVPPTFDDIRAILPTPLLSFPLPCRHSRAPAVIPAPLPSFPRPYRHSRAPFVIPAQAGIQ